MSNFVPQLLWVDLEMSGLDPIKNRILEFACILTDSRLQHQYEGPHLIIHCDEEHLQTMDEWNTRFLFTYLAITPRQDSTRAASTALFPSSRPRTRSSPSLSASASNQAN